MTGCFPHLMQIKLNPTKQIPLVINCVYPMFVNADCFGNRGHNKAKSAFEFEQQNKENWFHPGRVQLAFQARNSSQGTPFPATGVELGPIRPRIQDVREEGEIKCHWDTIF